MKHAPVLLALVLLFTACNGFSPTEPQTITSSSINGTWRASLPINPGGEDWSSITFDITSDVATMTPKSGPVHPVRVTTGAGWASLEIQELPVDPHAPCIQVQIAVTSMIDRGKSMLGQVSGRCPSTLMHDIRLDRV
jgi:hypothetical protein